MQIQKKYIGYIIILIFVIFVVALAATSDYEEEEETPTASAAADTFTSTYTDGGFGTFTVDDGATDEAASATSSINLAMGPHSRTFKVNFAVDDDAEATYTTQAGYLAGLKSSIGTPEKIDVSGYDNITAYKMDVNHYGMTFTFLYFIAYNDNLVISAFGTTESDGTVSADVWSGILHYSESNPTLSTDDQNLAVLQAVVTALGVDAEVSI